MKKLYIIILFVFSSIGFSQTFYSEDMGSPAANTAIVDNTFQNSAPIIYSGTADVRTSTASTGYTGASGNGNVFFTGTAGRFFLIEGINTSAYNSSELQLSFGHHKSTNASSNELIVEVSENGTDFTQLTYSRATGAGTANWTLITIESGIPSTTNLRIRFTQTSTAQFRIDDVKLTNVSATCALSLETPVVACEASTLALDNYTVTIPFTGGSSATYTINAPGATIGGDNPSSVATGNIVLTYTEGTNFDVEITGGTCNLEVSGNSTECKPINTLPVNEPFNYTVGSELNASQMWTNASVGSDNILVATGNLNYTGITSTGNHVSFAGTGSDPRLPFTETTSGELYVSFLTSVTDITGVSGTTYFAVLNDGSNSFTNARIWMRNDGTQYQFGISPTAAAGDIVWSANLFNVGSTQYLVLGYDFGTNTLSLFENPTIGGTASATVSVTPASAITSFAGFILRQDSATNTPAMLVDELTIDTLPNFTLSSSTFNVIDGLTMYPNPLKGNTLFLTSTANATMLVQIFDVLGKEVLKSNVTNNAVNVTGLNAGVYIVKVTEEGKTATRKLVIQ